MIHSLERDKNLIHFEGGEENIKKVFGEMRLFSKLGPASMVKPTLLVLGGAQKGVSSGGGVTAVEKAGLRNSFHTVIGVSTGAPVVSYLVTGQSEIGTSIYYKDNLGGQFLNARRGLTTGESIVDVTWLCDTFRGIHGNKALDVEALRNSPSNVLYVTTKESTGECIFLDAKKLGDPIEGIRASAAIPLLYKDEVIIDGERYVDGMVSGSCPIRKIVKDISPTSLLIFANKSKKKSSSVFFTLFKKLASVGKDKRYAESFLRQEHIFDEELSYLQESGIPYTIIWTDDLVGNLEQNPKKLKIAAKSFERYVTSLLRKY